MHFRLKPSWNLPLSLACLRSLVFPVLFLRLRCLNFERDFSLTAKWGNKRLVGINWSQKKMHFRTKVSLDLPLFLRSLAFLPFLVFLVFLPLFNFSFRPFRLRLRRLDFGRHLGLFSTCHVHLAFSSSFSWQVLQWVDRTPLHPPRLPWWQVAFS